MTERKYVEGKKPDREIPADKIGKLELPTEKEAESGATGEAPKADKPKDEGK